MLNGKEIALSPDTLIVLIGANSSGKSTILREITRRIQTHDTRSSTSGLVIGDAETVRRGNPREWVDWMRLNFPTVIDGGKRMFVTIDEKLSEEEINAGLTVKPVDSFSTYTSGLFHEKFAHFLIRSLNAETRLNLTRPVRRIDVLNEAPKHEFHALQANSQVLKAINSETGAAFDVSLMLDPGLGVDIGIRIGKQVPWTVDDDKTSMTYLKALRNSTTPLEQEGDGIRSFLGCLLALRCSPYKVFLVDEPEAFLHPPQARRLGRLLADTAQQEGRQVIVATHSSDIIKGALDSDGAVQICRVERIGNTTSIYTLDNQDLRHLWKKPLLRSTDAIQGAFHKGVIVCEGDADCRFYEGLALGLDGVAPIDIHFVHGAGSAGLPALAASYIELHVPVAVIADFDVLQDAARFKSVVESLGEDFSQIQSKFESINADLKHVAPVRDKSSIATTLRRHADELENGKSLSVETIKKIDRELAEASAWSQPKQHGINALKGQAHETCKTLLQELAEIGLFIVPVGELEGWERGLPASKSEWISDALRKVDDPERFGQARLFINRVVSYLAAK
ncbi:MAG: ATP-binding protein [Chloroflexi bacterium]|nr:ATP-binding protein [Chloroflexota bacterium]